MPTRRQRLSGVFVLIVVLAISSPSAAAESFQEAVRRYGNLSVDESSRRVTGASLSAGHLRLDLSQGSVAAVKAGNETVGLFFKGTGSVDYTSEDPVEFPVTTYNTKKNTGVTLTSAENKLVLKDKFEELLWLAGKEALPAFAETSPGPPLGEAFAKHRAKFERVRSTPLTHQFAAWRLNSPGSALVRAEIGGASEDLLYVLDAYDDREESLFAVRRNSRADAVTSDRLYAIPLSGQPIGRDRRVPAPPLFGLTHVDLAVTASDGKDVAISVTETVTALAEEVRTLRLDLYNTTFAYSGVSLSLRSLLVKGIYDEAGKRLPFDHQRDQLLIGLPAPLAARQSMKIRFEIEGDILFRPGGDNYWELGVAPWFPLPDLAGQCYTVHATIKVKKPFVPLAPGKTIRRESDGEWNILETRVDKPVQFMVVLAGKYYYTEETKNGVTVRVASYGMRNDRGIKKLLGLSHKIIEYYTPFLGPFPFDEFNIVEINAWGFGQAPPGFMFITSEAFDPIGGTVNRLFSKGINERFAHEIAHQYWGHALKMPSAEEQWLTESFAEISAGLLIRDLRGKNDYDGLVTNWRSNAKDSTAIAPIPLANRIQNFSDRSEAFMHRTSLLYSKGPYLLHSIAREIGDENFLKFLRSCQATFPWKFGNTKTVQQVLEAITKKDWKPFFEANYWGTGMPGK